MFKLENYPFISPKVIYSFLVLKIIVCLLLLNTVILLFLLYLLHKKYKKSPVFCAPLKKYKVNSRDYYFFLIIVFAGIVLRIFGIDKDNMGLREYYYFQNVFLNNLWEVIFNSLSVNLFHQPVYNLIIYFVSRISRQVIVLRMISLFFGILTAILLFKFAYRMFGRKAAFISVLLVSFNPMHIFWSQEISPYSLFCFISLLSYYSFYKAFIQNYRKTAVWYCFFIIIGFLCHFFMWFVVLSQILIFCTIYYIKKIRKNSRINSLYFLLTIVIFNYLLIAWFPFLYYALNNEVHDIIGLQNKICFLPQGYSSFLFFNLIPYFLGITLNYTFIIWLVIALFAISLMIMYKYFKTECLFLFIPIFAGLATVVLYLIIFTIKFKGLVIIWEYYIYLFPLITLTFAFFLARFMNKKLMLSILCLILIIMFYCDYGLFKKQKKPGFSEAVSFIKDVAVDGDALFFTHEWYAYIFYYYMLKTSDHIGKWPGIYVKTWRQLTRIDKTEEIGDVRYYGPLWQEMIYSQTPFLKKRISLKEDLDKAGVGRIWVLDTREQYFGIPMTGCQYNDDILAWFWREYSLKRYKEFEHIKLYLFDNAR